MYQMSERNFESIMITFDFNVSHLLGEIFTMKKILSQVISQRKIIIKKKFLFSLTNLIQTACSFSIRKLKFKTL